MELYAVKVLQKGTVHQFEWREVINGGKYVIFQQWIDDAEETVFTDSYIKACVNDALQQFKKYAETHGLKLGE